MDKKFLEDILKFLNNCYDSKEKMIVDNITPYTSNIIHTAFTDVTDNTLSVHSVLNSIKYAYLMLEHDKKASKRIIDIIQKVLSLQQNNPLKKYYGLWSYYLEEPIEKMPNPDENQASFVLQFLLLIYKNYRHLLSDKFLYMLESACCAAAIFIVNRNTGLQYSHIVILECYVCVLCGELFSRPEFVNYGMQKIEKFMFFVFSNGDFFEFNAPTMSILMATTLSGILQNVQNERVIDVAKRLNKFLWSGIAKHYHYATGQLAGPFSRTYSDFLRNKEKFTLNQATGGKVPLPPTLDVKFLIIDYPLYNAYCPPQFYPFFSGEKNVEYSQRLISHGASYPFFAFSQIATTYIRPKYSLGSFNRQEFWSERRPLISHFGAGENLYSMRIRCLLNNHDFSSAQLHCVQIKNSVLGHICFATNRGIRHMDFDKNYCGAVNISDFRIRFEINGDSSKLKIKQKDNNITIAYENLLFSFMFGFCKVDKLLPHIEILKEENKTAFDLVFYTGEEKEFHFEETECAICQFAMHISEQNHIFSPVENELTNGYLISRQKKGDFELLLKTPIKPNDWIFLMLYDSQEINGTRLENYARDTEESALQYEFIVNSSSEIPINISDGGNEPTDNILSKIEELSSIGFEEMHSECKVILDMIRTNNFSIDIAKRFAVRMLTKIFEVAKSYSLIFENAIKYEYSNIYISLSQNNSVNAIEKTINNVLNNLQIDYQLFSENEKNKSFIDNITGIIRQNYSDPELSLTYISEKTGLSETHISKAFHKRTGISYLQYLTRIRMEHAKELLDNGETDVTLIAAASGYENTSSFLRAFKRYTGSTVSAYLKKHN